MKKIITICLSIALLLSLVACTASDPAQENQTANQSDPTSNYDENQVPDDVPGSTTDEEDDSTEPTEEPVKTLADVDAQFAQIQATGEIIPEGAPVYDYFFLACMDSFWVDSTYAVIPKEVTGLGNALSMLESKTWGEVKTIKLSNIKALNATLTASEFGALITFTSEETNKTVEQAVADGEWVVVIIGAEDIKTTLNINASQSIAEAILSNFGQPTEVEYENSQVDDYTVYSVTYSYQLTNAVVQLQLTKGTDSLLTGDYVCAIAISPVIN